MRSPLRAIALPDQSCGLLLNAPSFWRNPEGHPSSAANFTFALGQAHGSSGYLDGMLNITSRFKASASQTPLATSYNSRH
jgi:hypothetical protein